MKPQKIASSEAEAEPHVPNRIPLVERVLNVVLSASLIVSGTQGVLNNDIHVPGKRSDGFHVHGFPMWLIYLAMLCAVANLIAVVVDHYDHRDNERDYKRFARRTQVCGFVLFFLAVLFKP